MSRPDTFPLTAVAIGMCDYALMNGGVTAVVLSIFASIVAVSVVIMVLYFTVHALRDGKLFRPDPVVIVLFQDDDASDPKMDLKTKRGNESAALAITNNLSEVDLAGTVQEKQRIVVAEDNGDESSV